MLSLASTETEINPEHTMKKLLLSIVCLLLVQQVLFAAPFIAEKDYHIINNDRAPQQQVHVVEFFSYGCPGCNFIESRVAAWLKEKPTYVTFSRVPLTFEPGWDTYAKAYYLAKTLGIEQKITPALFNAIHGNNGTEYHDLSSAQAITDFFVKQGVQRGVAAAAFSGTNAALTLQVKQGSALMLTYGVESTPAFVIAEKYRVSMRDAKSPQRLMQIVTFLIKKVHRA